MIYLIFAENSPRAAKLELGAHVRLERLHVVVDHGQGDDAGHHGHRAHHHAEEGHSAHVPMLLALRLGVVVGHDDFLVDASRKFRHKKRSVISGIFFRPFYTRGNPGHKVLRFLSRLTALILRRLFVWGVYGIHTVCVLITECFKGAVSNSGQLTRRVAAKKGCCFTDAKNRVS